MRLAPTKSPLQIRNTRSLCASPGCKSVNVHCKMEERRMGEPTFLRRPQNSYDEHIQRDAHDTIQSRSNAIIDDLATLIRNKWEVNATANFKDAEAPESRAFIADDDGDAETEGGEGEGHYEKSGRGDDCVDGGYVVVDHGSEHHGAH